MIKRERLKLDWNVCFLLLEIPFSYIFQNQRDILISTILAKSFNLVSCQNPSWLLFKPIYGKSHRKMQISFRIIFLGNSEILCGFSKTYKPKSSVFLPPFYFNKKPQICIRYTNCIRYKWTGRRGWADLYQQSFGNANSSGQFPSNQCSGSPQNTKE